MIKGGGPSSGGRTGEVGIMAADRSCSSVPVGKLLEPCSALPQGMWISL